MKYIVPLMKSPFRLADEPWWKRRFGPDFLQDWYGALRAARSYVDCLDVGSDEAVICVISENKFAEKPETELYMEALKEMGMGDYSNVISEGTETIGQMCAILQRCNDEDEVTFISSPLHLPRVWWLCRGCKIATSHKVAWGIPRPWEALTDAILAVVFPILDYLGYRDAFLAKTQKRRAAGVL